MNIPKITTIGVIIIVGFLIIGGILAKKFVGDVRPVVIPTGQDIAAKLNPKGNASGQGERVDFLKVPDGYQARYFAKNLDNARDFELSPGGVLVVSLTGPGQVVALPDQNKDGVADENKVLLSGLSRPHGLVFYKDWLFVAEETRVTRYFWDEQKVEAKIDRRILDLPKGGNHFTRDLVFNSKGELFVSLGSTCNVCVEKHEWLAAVVKTNENGETPKLFAKGLRNSVFLTVNPKTDEVWAGDMGRDLIGDDRPKEEINIIREGRDYGWPYCYEERVHDNDFDPENRRSCGETEPPVYGYQAHSAPLGITFIDSPLFPDDWQGDLLVSYHGSWNRSAPVGYKIVRFDVSGNSISGESDFISGFLKGSTAEGRPVDIVLTEEAAYISDDKAGAVYRLTRN